MKVLVLILLTILACNFVIADNIEFRANMSVQAAKGTFNPVDDVVHVRGTFNGWSTIDTLVDGDHDLIYTKTIAFGAGDTMLFKFEFRDLSAGSDIWEGSPNRSYAVPSGGGVFADFFNRDSTLPAVSLGGDVFIDVDSSGTREEGEPGLANWSVVLSGPTSDSAITDGFGHYSFTIAQAGSYTVCVAPDSNFVPVTLLCIPLTLPSGGGWDSIVAVDPIGIYPHWSPFSIVYQGLMNSSVPCISSAAEWGDFNKDGKLDAIAVGYSATQYFEQDASPSDVDFTTSNAVACGDYNNDGNLDFVQAVSDGASPSLWLRTKALPSGFSYVGFGDPTTANSSVAWGDYDNDGLSDLLVVSSVITLFHNESAVSPSFVPNTTWLNGSNGPAGIASAAWGDFDRDGLLDIVCAVQASSQWPLSLALFIYKNNGDGSFTEFENHELTNADNSAPIPHTEFGFLAVGHFDGDDELDVLLTTPTYGSAIYYNNGGGFDAANRAVSVQANGTHATVGDYSNDGLLDFAVNGAGHLRIFKQTSLGEFPQARLTFPIGLSDMWGSDNTGCSGTVAWGDYDADGDLDLLVTGDFVQQSWNPLAGYYDRHVYFYRIYRNDLSTAHYFRNPVPISANVEPVSPPCSGSAVVMANNEDLIFSMTNGSDNETSQSNLTYNFRVGSASGTADVRSPMADLVTGFRSVPQLGNVRYTPFSPFPRWTLKNAASGTYFYSVQAIDNQLAGSPFSCEKSVTVNTIVVTGGDHGTIFPGSNVLVMEGGNKTFTINASGGVIEHLLVDGSEILGATGATWYQYSFVDIQEDRSIHVTFGPGKRDVPVDGGWNLVSVPLLTSDSTKSALFPSATSGAYTFAGGYLVEDTLRKCVGYWLKFAGPQTISIAGYRGGRETICVAEKWNMIGAISDPIPVGRVSAESLLTLSQFFGYDRGYYVADTLKPGRGYWVKADRAGKFILASGDSMLSSNRIKFEPTPELPPAPPEGSASVPVMVPSMYVLSQNYPNPFNPTTVITYGVPTDNKVRIDIFNTLGQRVVSLVDAHREAGYHETSWNASHVASGLYFYRLEAVDASDPTNAFTQTKKMLLAR